MAHVVKWPDEQRAFILSLWDKGLSSSQIAEQFTRSYGPKVSRNVIIGIVNRAGGSKRDPGVGSWATAGAQKRHQTMLANGGYTGPKKKSAPVDPPKPPTSVLGTVEEMVGDGMCKFPVSGPGEPWQQCGHPAQPHKPYCAGHCATAYTPQSKPMKGN